MLCLAAQGFSQGLPWADVDLNKKDFTGNLVLTDRDYLAAELAQYPAVEYPATPPIRGVAYRRGITVTVVWTIKNNHSFVLQGTLNILGARLKSPGPNTESPPGSGNWSNPDEFRTLACSPATTALTLAADGGSQNVTLTFLGVPNHVCLGDLEVNYTMPLVRPSDGAQGENGSNGGYETFTRLFVVDAQPTGLQSVPWADFLEYTCRWGWGAVGTTDLKEKMTRGMHYSNRSATRRLQYNSDQAVFFSPNRTPTGDYGDRWFSLGWFTYSLETQFTTEGDCRDFAGALTLAILANGLSAVCLWMENTPPDNDPANNFATTMLCNANMDSNDPTLYSQRSFNFHVVCKAGGTTQDAAVSYFYLPSGSVHKNPAWGWNEDDHWQKPVGGTNYGLCASSETAWTPRPVFVPVHLNPYVP